MRYEELEKRKKIEEKHRGNTNKDGKRTYFSTGKKKYDSFSNKKTNGQKKEKKTELFLVSVLAGVKLCTSITPAK